MGASRKKNSIDISDIEEAICLPAGDIRPLKIDRFKKIISLVNKEQRISLAQLEKSLNASRITIQRDLQELENRNLLRRFHGGATSLVYSKDIYDIDKKKSMHITAKRKIALKAAQLIEEGFYIGLDASSTVYYLSETLLTGNILTFACGIDAFMNLTARDDIQAVLAGGRLNKKTKTLSGPELLDMIGRFHFDLSFISAESFIPGVGFFDPHASEVQVKRALMECSNKTVMLIDASKITDTANGSKICDCDEVTYVVTDNPELVELKKIFKDRLL